MCIPADEDEPILPQKILLAEVAHNDTDDLAQHSSEAVLNLVIYRK